MFVMILIRYSTYSMLSGVGKGMTERALINYRLQYLFGDIFKSGSDYYTNPDVKDVVRALLHRALCVAANAVIPAAAIPAVPNVSLASLFAPTTGRRHHVNETELQRLGCSKKMLATMFNKTRAIFPAGELLVLPPR